MELAERVPAVAVFAVLSVLAYVIGSIATDLTRKVRDEMAGEFEWDFGKRPQANISEYAWASLQQLLTERVSSAQSKLLAAGEDLSALPTRLLAEEGRAGIPPGWTDDKKQWPWQLTMAMHTQTLRELGLVRFRLMGDQPELFAHVDRSQSEADLRRAVALPLYAIAVIIAARTSPLWAALVVLAGFALVASVLLWSAATREREANDALIDALFIEKVQAPALDQLRRATEDVENETEEQRDRRLEEAARLAEERQKAIEERGEEGLGC